MADRYRTGRSVGRTIYRVGEDGFEELIGVMDTRELAVQVVEALNGVTFRWTRPGIPEDAVELAARAVHAFAYADPETRCKAWEAHSDGYREAYRKLARNALTAVAPIIVADAISDIG